ncbi:MULTISPECIES: HpcH/HpaI aldolase/citrate lyase family protein [unclassified Nocardia]|uniref:HpcH/HpaI aldolase/citrate lyase family protein n=1 Tax=unclassified Nocardia TaxID=2637762 RepID=UPI0035E31175
MGQQIAPRSWLSVPATRPELIGKAVHSGAEGIIIDLEDSVAPSEKDGARAGLASMLARARAAGAPVLVVRVNAPGTPWCHLDVAACAEPGGPDSIMLPKTDCPGDIAFADRLLHGTRARSGRTDPVRLYALLESAAAIAAAREIAHASPLLRGVALGYADLGASLGRRGVDRWCHAQDAMLFAARSAGVEAIDGPQLGVLVDDEFASSATESARLGFDGKWVIHPRQVPVVNAAFRPSEDEIADAEATVAAVHANHRRGIGAFTRDGRMIDDAVAAQARRVLARAGSAISDIQERQ